MTKFKLVSLLIISLFLTYDGVSAQVAAGKPKEKEEKLEFLFVNTFPVNIVHQYVFKDSTNVNRMYSDS